MQEDDAAVVVLLVQVGERREVDEVAEVMAGVVRDAKVRVVLRRRYVSWAALPGGGERERWLRTGE